MVCKPSGTLTFNVSEKSRILGKEASQIKPVDGRKRSHFQACLPVCGGGKCNWFVLCICSQSVNTKWLYFILLFTFIASSSALRNPGLPQRTQPQLGCITFQAAFYFFETWSLFFRLQSPVHCCPAIGVLPMSIHQRVVPQQSADKRLS